MTIIITEVMIVALWLGLDMWIGDTFVIRLRPEVSKKFKDLKLLVTVTVNLRI